MSAEKSFAVWYRRLRSFSSAFIAIQSRSPRTARFRCLGSDERFAYTAMGGQNLGAVDRVVKIVRELDRYHGLAATDFIDAPPPRLATPKPPLALPVREEAREPEAL